MDTKTKLESELRNLFDRLPLDRAMPNLLGSGNLDPEEVAIVGSLQTPLEITSALWLYVGDLERSHAVSQNIPSPTGSYWHGIMHRREGDFPNAKYWFRKAVGHAVIDIPNFDPCAFTDECEQDRGQNSPKLVEMQRLEWKTLFDRCTQEAGIVRNW
jgi:hypothetical protein